MLFWDGAQYRPISPEEAKYRVAEGQVPKVNADIPPGDECPMCTGEILHVHTDEPSIHQQPAVAADPAVEPETSPAAPSEPPWARDVPMPDPPTGGAAPKATGKARR